MIKQNLSQNDSPSLDHNSWSSHLRWKTSLFLLSTTALLVPSLPLRAEMVKGVIENYSPQNQQATISLGEEDGVGKYDRGKIQLTSLDSPNTKFIGANITVISVEENSAVVSVSEAPGIQVPIAAGAEIVLDTDSGLAQREEEAKVIAREQAEEARRQQQLEEARAEVARRQREAEVARAEVARRQREAEEARIIEARRQQQLEAERIEQARQQQQAEAEAPTAQQPDIALEPSPQQDRAELEEAEELWNSEAEGEDVDKLPSDYLLAYTNAREQPSPESYYKFAQVLIKYEIFDKASQWLEETKVRFPETAAVNNIYRGVALIEQGDVEAGQEILATTNLPPDPLTNDLKTYSYINQGQWDRALSLSNTKTAASYNNNLIALYCKQPFTFDRDTNLPPGNCPLPHESFEIEDDYEDTEELTEFEQNERNKQAIAKLAQEAIAAYPENPYILNTLGFIALQLEDYETAYDRYQQLSKLLARGSKIPPRFQILKANADNYATNYGQNHDFLASNTSDLASQRSEQDSVTDAIIIGGVGSTVTGVLRDDVGPVGIAGGIISMFLGMNRSKSRAESIEEERNSVLDQMHETFTKDMNLVPTPPELEANSLLKLTNG